MRKRNFKLIRKTIEWLHRRRGTSTVKLPADVDNERYRYLKIYGSDAENSAGVGDYNEEVGLYTIPVHIHGNNLMGGPEFMAVHSALNISKVPASIVNGCYTLTPMIECNGTVIIGPDLVKFKKKTAYTLAAHIKFMTSATKRRFGFRFDYSDGTYYFPVVDSSYRDFYICFTSDPTKDVVAISSHAETTANMRIDLEGFGLYEGEHTDYYTVNEEYLGERIVVSLDAPLRKIDYASDELDIISGTLTRKIKSLTIDETSDFSSTDDEAVFSISLPKPMRAGSRIVSAFGDLTEDCESGLSPSDDGTSFLFKASPEITSEDSLRAYLEENPFEIAYIMSEYEYTATEKTALKSYEKELTMEPLCSSEPSKIIAEYV